VSLARYMNPMYIQEMSIASDQNILSFILYKCDFASLPASVYATILHGVKYIAFRSEPDAGGLRTTCTPPGCTPLAERFNNARLQPMRELECGRHTWSKPRSSIHVLPAPSSVLVFVTRRRTRWSRWMAGGSEASDGVGSYDTYST
jgi:hypothetical protein